MIRKFTALLVLKWDLSWGFFPYILYHEVHTSQAHRICKLKKSEPFSINLENFFKYLLFQGFVKRFDIGNKSDEFGATQTNQRTSYESKIAFCSKMVTPDSSLRGETFARIGFWIPDAERGLCYFYFLNTCSNFHSLFCFSLRLTGTKFVSLTIFLRIVRSTPT